MDGQSLSKQNYNSIDLFKLFFAFAVVSIHTRPLVYCSVDWITRLNEIIVTLAVPFFYIVSGFLLGKKISSGNEYNSEPIKKLLFRFLKLYCAWTFVYLPLSIIHYFREGTSLLSAIKLFIVGFVFVGEQYNAWILWYLLSAVYALIVIIIINRTRITHKKLCVTTLIALVLSTMLAYLSAYDGDLNGFLEVAKRLDIVVFSKGRILRGLIYLPLGIIFSYHHLSKKLGITLFLICTGIRLLVYSEIIETFLILCSAAGLFTMVKSISLKDNQIYRCFRSMSSSIYYIHLYVWTLAYMILYGSKTYGFKIFMITAVTSGTIAFLYWCFSKQKHFA